MRGTVLSSLMFAPITMRNWPLQKGSYNGDSSSGSTNRDGVNGISRTAAIVLDEALASLQPALRDKNGVWTADYVRLRFKAHLPEDSSAGTAVDKSGRESVA